jgi:ribosome maturation factor RimP
MVWTWKVGATSAFFVSGIPFGLSEGSSSSNPRRSSEVTEVLGSRTDRAEFIDDRRARQIAPGVECAFVGARGRTAMYRDIPEELRSLIEPIVEDAGLELVDVALQRGRPPWLLRVTVDTRVGDGRVPVDRCADVSREIGTALDAADAIASRYRLEVSSPGLDRLLAREKDFLAARGDRVSIETRRPIEGRRRFRGTLLAFADATAHVDVDGTEFRIPFEDVAKARTIYEFTSADFAGDARSR